MGQKEELLRIFSLKVRELIRSCDFEFEKLQEIRMRVGQPMILCYQNRETFLSIRGEMTDCLKEAFYVNQKEIKETMEYIGNYSLYAFEDEVRQGFITIQGGHRVGVAGRAIWQGNGIRNLKHISFLNIRLAHEIQGCADAVLPLLIQNGQVCHTLIISPPGCGKTTLLRDCIRLISNGTKYLEGKSVGVVDERSELGGSYLGIPQNDLGMRTDVLDCCPKSAGILMLVRSMSPDVIAVDEVGTSEDISAIEMAFYCGCKLLVTVHGDSFQEIKEKPLFAKLLEKQLFDRYVVLSRKEKIGFVKGIYDERGRSVTEVGEW